MSDSPFNTTSGPEAFGFAPAIEGDDEPMDAGLRRERDRYRVALEQIAGMSFLGIPSAERMDIIHETATEALSPNPSETAWGEGFDHCDKCGRPFDAGASWCNAHPNPSETGAE